MTVVQGIQSKQFALETRATGVDAVAAHRARMTLADLVLRNDAAHAHAVLRDALEMLGLAEASSVTALAATR